MTWFKQFCTAGFCLLLSFSAHADATLLDVYGQRFSFSALKGQWVFINYWASWCQTCLDEIPALNRFYEKNKHNHVALFAVNYDGLPLAAQLRLVKHFNIHYPALGKDPANALHLGNINGVPATFVFNPQGDLVDTLYGEQTVSSLTRSIEEQS